MQDPLARALIFLSKNKNALAFFSLEIIVTGVNHTISLLNLRLLKILHNVASENQTVVITNRE